MDDEALQIEILPSIAGIAAAEWDSCACPEISDGRPFDPFTTHRFLKALEDSRSVGRGTGWEPHHLIVRQGGEVIAVAPLYAKSHSQGEYIFDHNWAHALESAGGAYYPKLQVSVPFTPVTGRRFLTRPGYETFGQAALTQAGIELATRHNLSSLHTTFCTEGEAKLGAEMGLLHRVSQQFHWINRGYGSFDDFLSALSSRKRKNIRKERKTAQSFGGEIVQLSGKDIRPEHWTAFWAFYQDTGARKWGRPYLSRAFFDHLHETMVEDVLLVLALKGDRPIAGALNFIGRKALYGRYWGTIEDHACMHFELCYYQAIDYAIAHGLECVEAGAQGEHKLARGYLPVQCHSLHWIANEGFRDAIQRFLEAERAAVDEDIEVLTDYGPFKNTQVEEHQ